MITLGSNHGSFVPFADSCGKGSTFLRIFSAFCDYLRFVKGKRKDISISVCGIYSPGLLLTYMVFIVLTRKGDVIL